MTESTATSEIAEGTTDPGAQRVAGVYAKAFLAAVMKAGAADAAMEELAAIQNEVLARHPRLVNILASAFVSGEDKLKIVDQTFGGRVLPLVLDFLRVLARHERLDSLAAIVQVARTQFDELRGLVRVEVTTASPLTDALTAKIKDQLRGMLGGEPVLVPKISPELIGGVVLRVGDTVYDGSVAARLAQVRSQIINRSVHEIQSGRDRFRNPAGN